MKTKFTIVAVAAMATALAGCKKENDVQPVVNRNTTTLSTLSSATPSYAVETLYGLPYATGNTDAIGKNARFNTPQGIQIMPDGSLFVADTYNNAIRKILPSGAVTTVNFKPDANGLRFTHPVYIGVEFKTGNIHIIQDGNIDNDAYDQSWIYKANGDLLGQSYYTYLAESALARDPYKDFFYFSLSNGIEKHQVQPDGEVMGEGLPIDVSKLEWPESEGPRGFSFQAIAVGYNNVVYFTYNGRIYKYTPGGVTQRIFSNLALSHITSMVLNKDSRTLYVADNGYIKRIDSGKLKVIAGPRGTNDGRDGANLTADVYAHSLALGKGENVLYFTDPHANTVRKITLN
jgi:hypothetical protein